jgi:hypothetical protein
VAVLIALVAVAGIVAGVLLARLDGGTVTPRMGQGGMSPGMMVVDTDRMGDTCEEWMAANPARATDVDAQAWCDSMAEWMSEHMGG